MQDKVSGNRCMFCGYYAISDYDYCLFSLKLYCAGVPGKIMNNYCWIMSTYTLPRLWEVRSFGIQAVPSDPTISSDSCDTTRRTPNFANEISCDSRFLVTHLKSTNMQGETNVDFIHPGVGPIDDGRPQEVAHSQSKKPPLLAPLLITLLHAFVLAKSNTNCTPLKYPQGKRKSTTTTISGSPTCWPFRSPELNWHNWYFTIY